MEWTAGRAQRRCHTSPIHPTIRPRGYGVKARFAAASLALVALLAGCQKSATGPRTVSARVDYVNGDVRIDGAAVGPGTTIKPVFSVTTGVDSSVGIVFDEKNILHVDAQTEAYIDLTADVRSVELRRGTLASALRKLSQVTAADPERFRVKTPSAVAGVRGTVFFIRVEDTANTYVCTCNGTLRLDDSRDANPFQVRAAHHEAYRFTASTEAVAVSPAQMLYHTDQMMELGAARIGETIDWTQVGK